MKKEMKHALVALGLSTLLVPTFASQVVSAQEMIRIPEMKVFISQIWMLKKLLETIQKKLRVSY